MKFSSSSLTTNLLFSRTFSSNPSPPPRQTQAIADPIQGRGKGSPEAKGKLSVNTQLGSEPGILEPSCLFAGA